MTIRRRIIGACLLMAPFFVSAGGAMAQQPAHWKHGLTASDLDSAFTTLASTRDFAKKQGVDIEFVKFNSDALALKALISGEIDSYEGSPGSPLIGLSKGVDLKLVGCYWPGLTYGLYSKDTIKSPAELAGKTVGISAPNSLPDILTRVILGKSKVDAKTVSFAALGSDAARFSALYAGSADAVAASTSYVPVVQKGYHLLASALEDAPEFLRLCTYMAPSAIRDRHDAATRFMAAEMTAIQYGLQHRDEFIDYAQKAAKLPADDPRTAYIFDEAAKYKAIDPTMAIPVDRVKWLKDLLVQTGSITADFDASKIVDDTVRQDAVKLANIH